MSRNSQKKRRDRRAAARASGVFQRPRSMDLDAVGLAMATDKAHGAGALVLKLADGRRVWLRFMVPSDIDVLVAGLMKLKSDVWPQLVLAPEKKLVLP